MDIDYDALREIAIKRYQAKREDGVSAQRSDGSFRSLELEIQTMAADVYAWDQLGKEMHTTPEHNYGDAGPDFPYITVDIGNGPERLKGKIVYLGLEPYEIHKAGSPVKKGLRPRVNGNLIMSPQLTSLFSDFYVVVRGSNKHGFELLGWATHESLINTHDKRSFGYGPRFWLSIQELRPMDELKVVSELGVA